MHTFHQAAQSNVADIVDKAIEDSPWSRNLQGVPVKIVSTGVVAGVLVAGFSTLGPTEPLVWVLAAAASVGAVAVWVVARRVLVRPDVISRSPR